MTKLSERTQISDANLTDDCFVHIVKPGTPDTSWYGTLEQLRNTIGGSWTRATFSLTQAEVRLLNSANGGKGYELFDALGANKVAQISNPLLFYKRTGGVVTTNQNIHILSNGGYESFSATLGVYLGDVDFPVQMFGTAIGGANSGAYETNAKMFLQSDTDFADYEGTAKLILDYRVIDFT